MSFAFLAEQSFNALQLGLMLFLMAVGVTLAFGTMRLINLAHGSFFMVAAFMYLGLTILAMVGMHFLEKRAARGFVRTT